MNYESIIGLEVHAQLATKSKMFCACSTAFGNPPNSNICPVCMGAPGALPVVNFAAVEMAIKAGLAFGSQIQHKSIFARKNYFYPDLSKGYQISQYEFPLCLGGHLDIPLASGETKRISITRIHMEEDAGKLTHDYGHAEKSHVDFNRCGVGLIEIVSGPDMRTPQEAADYFRKVRQILVYLGVCHGNMQEGNLRCDANVSIRKVGDTKLGTRTEMKNLNSFKAVERAIAYEINRQIAAVERGEIIIQETLLWDDAAGKSASLRSKEDAHDYRYFPDPDLLPLIVTTDWIEGIRKQLPELAAAKAARFVRDYGIPEYDAEVLTAERDMALYYEKCIAVYNSPKKISNWIMTELLRELKNEGIDITACRITPEHLAQLVTLIDDGIISGKIGKDVFEEMYTTGHAPAAIIDTKGLKLVSDTSELDAIIERVLSTNQKQVEQYKSGKVAVFGFLVGQVMKETKGQASPQVVNELLKKKLS
ncbi:MAG: Asp-tRNA(Asn)/Glu-tRNA(Gln) amidotransferase subunit GatB [Deltaproteobacteria bacterium]|nr:Asp-tRNA(Asn)/Glu-tRNA(Gln) amidotransferase subunit GatB [Deltaproteobacteria bacterium]